MKTRVTSPRVSVARLRALLRRTQLTPTSTSAEASIEVAGLSIEPGTRSAKINGKTLLLTSSEFNILLTLAQRAGSVISKSELSEQAMGRPLELFDRSIDMHVSHLRKKLGDGPDGGERIMTVRGIGYQMVLP